MSSPWPPTAPPRISTSNAGSRSRPRDWRSWPHPLRRLRPRLEQDATAEVDSPRGRCDGFPTRLNRPATIRRARVLRSIARDVHIHLPLPASGGLPHGGLGWFRPGGRWRELHWCGARDDKRDPGDESNAEREHLLEVHPSIVAITMMTRTGMFARFLRPSTSSARGLVHRGGTRFHHGRCQRRTPSRGGVRPGGMRWRRERRGAGSRCRAKLSQRVPSHSTRKRAATGDRRRTESNSPARRDERGAKRRAGGARLSGLRAMERTAVCREAHTGPASTSSTENGSCGSSGRILMWWSPALV